MTLEDLRVYRFTEFGGGEPRWLRELKAPLIAAEVDRTLRRIYMPVIAQELAQESALMRAIRRRG